MRRKHGVRLVICLVGATFGGVGVSSLSAYAATGRIIATIGLNIRSGPSTSSSIIGTLNYGATVDLDCYVNGDAVTGPYGTTTIWDHLTGGGYISDAWTYTGSNNAVVPVCGSAAPPPPTPPPPSPSPSNQFRVAWTGIGVYPRAGTSMSSAKVGAALADGTLVTVACETTGDTITDTAGYVSSIWDQLTNGTYISNAFLNTGVDGWTPGVPRCSASGGGTPPVANAFFNRSATLAWATANARDVQSVDEMCTWFVSNALWAGGFHKSSTWTDQGSHGTVQKRPGTVTAWAATNFIAYARANFSTTWTPLGTLSNTNNAVPNAQVGDIIAYDWGQGAGISHLAIVVNIAPGQYPEVAEWGQSPYTLIYGRTYTSGYTKRGWTYSAVRGKWLQDVYGGHVQAYLLHFNGGYFVSGY